MHDEILPWKQLNTCLLMGSTEQIPYFVLLVHRTSALLVNLVSCFYFSPQVLRLLLFQFSLSYWGRVSKWLHVNLATSQGYTTKACKLKSLLKISKKSFFYHILQTPYLRCSPGSLTLSCRLSSSNHFSLQFVFLTRIRITEIFKYFKTKRTCT